jgi:hypothetical protein
VDELCVPEIAPAVKAWIGPFHTSFPDVHMEVVDLVAEGHKVASRFTCSGTHEGEWRGHAPTGRRFEQVDEVYFFRLRDGKERDDRQGGAKHKVGPRRRDAISSSSCSASRWRWTWAGW